MSKSIQIHDQKPVVCKLVDTEYYKMTLRFPLLPSRGTINRNQNSDQIPYEIVTKSMSEKQYPESVYEMDSPYIIRDYRGVTIRLCPFQYNAVEQKLLIFTRIVVEVTETEGIGENAIRSRNM